MDWQGSHQNAASTNTMSRFETETLTQEDTLQGLARMNTQWVDAAMAHTPHRRVILDLDSSKSPVHTASKKEPPTTVTSSQCAITRSFCSTSSGTAKVPCSGQVMLPVLTVGESFWRRW